MVHCLGLTFTQLTYFTTYVVNIIWHLSFQHNVWLMHHHHTLWTSTGPINCFMKDRYRGLLDLWVSACENKWVLNNDPDGHPADRKSPLTWLYIIMVLSSGFVFVHTQAYTNMSMHQHIHMHTCRGTQTNRVIQKYYMKVWNPPTCTHKQAGTLCLCSSGQ